MQIRHNYAAYETIMHSRKELAPFSAITTALITEYFGARFELRAARRNSAPKDSRSLRAPKVMLEIIERKNNTRYFRNNLFKMHY